VDETSSAKIEEAVSVAIEETITQGEALRGEARELGLLEEMARLLRTGECRSRRRTNGICRGFEDDGTAGKVEEEMPPPRAPTRLRQLPSSSRNVYRDVSKQKQQQRRLEQGT
jgi:hypothetical protein